MAERIVSAGDAFEIIETELRNKLEEVRERIIAATHKADTQAIRVEADRLDVINKLLTRLETLEDDVEALTNLMPVSAPKSQPSISSQIRPYRPENYFQPRQDKPTSEPSRNIKSDNRLPKGLLTPEKEFVIPILQVLVEIGGSGSSERVLDLVYQKVKGKLNKYDLMPVPSDGVTPRWRNRAAWVRNDLREQSLLKGTSSHGIWEISEQGRAWLQRGRS
jgi:hypothetical protein